MDMTALEEFENTLKEVVGAKRLSASKMSRLTEIAMKSLENDTKLVAVLYRTHKSLPNSAKVSSLYAFDALARAARSLVTKRGITGDINSSKGNAATFLLKIEGILDGLFQDMGSLGNSETKEKTKKVLDIWVKSNTFPSPVLTRLRDALSDVRKESTVNPETPIDPHATTVPNSSDAPASDVQATLLALLGQAAQLTGREPSGQTPPNTDLQLQHTQLALLQHLTAKFTNGSPTPEDNPLPARRPSPRFDAPADEARSGYPNRARDPREERTSRGGARGGYRGRGRWDDHNRFRHRDRDREPHSRPRRSRSRSPRRHEERQNARTYSPVRRPSTDKDPQHQPEPLPPPASPGKDEFGRDIRSSSISPSRSTSVEALAPMDTSVDPTPGALPDNHIPVSDPLPVVAASTSAQSTEPLHSASQQPGLDEFDISTFDATAPSSWEALGNMWQASYGYVPSQEELMHFVMTGSMAAAGMANGAPGGQWQRRGGGGRGGGRGMEPSEPSSYAIVLNGDSTDDRGKAGGRMQRQPNSTLMLSLARRARSFQTTVNADEIAHFSRLSSEWWNEHGECALLHRMNPTRVRYIREKLAETTREEQGEEAGRAMEQRRDALRGLDVLDVGCGGGLLSESLARMGARTLGIDASASNVGIASTHASADPELSSMGTLAYRNVYVEELVQEPTRYDVVCSMEVLEHVDNPAGFLAMCAELVKPGGHLFLSTVARTPLSYLLTILAAEHVLRMVPVGTHTYSKFVNPLELVSFFAKHPSPSRPWITRTYEHGLPTRTEAEVRGIIYVPWSGNWQLMSRGATPWGAAECNYLFWVRRPLES